MNTNGFDPFQWRAFFFPGLTRDEATKLLSDSSVSIGTFLLRESSSPGDYSLTVRESNEGNIVRHYLIKQENNEDGATVVKIANQCFPDIPALLNHYKMRVLDNASLIHAYRKPIIETVIGNFKFNGERETDLPFEVGEKLEIITKANNDWWEARNALGSTGLIPSNYVSSIHEYSNDRILKGTSQSSLSSSGGGGGEEQHGERLSSTSTNSDTTEIQHSTRLPADAKVIYDRNPNAYDPTQLRLKKGQNLKVIQKLTNGMYRAEANGLTGLVPFTYIRFLQSNEENV